MCDKCKVNINFTDITVVEKKFTNKRKKKKISLKEKGYFLSIRNSIANMFQKEKSF